LGEEGVVGVVAEIYLPTPPFGHPSEEGIFMPVFLERLISLEKAKLV
jgi:hypothetical protein